MTHAKFGSPSRLYSLSRCPGQVAFGRDIPEPPPSPYAEEGTIFHNAMEKLLPKYLQGKKLPAFEHSALTYHDMKEYVLSTLELVKQKWVSFVSKHKDPKFKVELKVKVNEDIFGTADVVFYGENIKTKKTDVVVIDYKYGQGVRVSAEENLQGIAYLIGAINVLGIENLGTGVVIIAQVRLEDGWTQHNINVDTLKGHRDLIQNIVLDVKEMFQGTVPVVLHAGSHCRFCKCASICPENKKEHYDVVISGASELPLETILSKLTLDQKVEIFLKKSAIEDFLSAVAKDLQAAFETGLTHPALKLIMTKGRRGWDDSLPVDRLIQALLELGVKEPAVCKPLGITEVEKQIGKGKIDGLVRLYSGKKELVRADHKSPAINIADIQELPE